MNASTEARAYNLFDSLHSFRILLFSKVDAKLEQIIDKIKHFGSYLLLMQQKNGIFATYEKMMSWLQPKLIVKHKIIKKRMQLYLGSPVTPSVRLNKNGSSLILLKGESCLEGNTPEGLLTDCTGGAVGLNERQSTAWMAVHFHNHILV